ncbi:MAG TPA: hypothetical protein VHU17_16975, partial [Acidimicrobiales bacterium]|nr:hypothetical protein [Acidimicrobiales bacterium]
VEETATESRGVVEDSSVDAVTATVVESSAPAPAQAAHPSLSSDQDRPIARAEPRDAPYCYQCGNAMQRAGSCYVCGSCGTTSGCS